MSLKIHCIVCRWPLKNLDEDGFHPSGGLAFYSQGHYGSSVFDPMDGKFLELAICDVCLLDNKVDIVQGTPIRHTSLIEPWKPKT